MKQINVQGAPIHVPALGVEVGPGGTVDHPTLLAGFAPAPKPPAGKAIKKTTAPKPAANNSTADKE